MSQLGGLDILVNNAARQQQKKSILELTTEDFDATFKTNVYAMFWITKAAMPHLKAGASIGADTPLGRPGQPAELASVYVMLASQESSYTTGNKRR